jgi:hypothetical protein
MAIGNPHFIYFPLESLSNFATIFPMAGPPLNSLEVQVEAKIQAQLSQLAPQLARDQADLSKAAQPKLDGARGLAALADVSEAVRRLQQRLKGS